MATAHQLIFKTPRKSKQSYSRRKLLDNCPQRLVTCIKVYTTKPKKPNSAIRKIAKVTISNTEKTVIIAIPGQGHSLQKHSQLLMCGGYVRDIPGVNYKAIRGQYDLHKPENIKRGRRLSKYGLSTKAYRLAKLAIRKGNV